MADYDQIMRALRNAHAAGDKAAAQRLAQMAREAKPSQPLRQPAGTPTEGYNPPERTMMQSLYENVIGRGAVDTPGERAGELLRGVGAGAARGAMELVGIPGTISQLMDAGAKKVGLLNEDAPESPVFSALSGQGIRGAAGSETGGATEFRAPGTAGDFASTIGEFLPGALGGGAGTLLRMGVAPAVASEAAGQATEGTAFEPYARAVAAIGTSLLGNRPGAFPGDDEAARMANVMQDAGVPVTAGQARGSQPLMRMEGRLQATDEQLAAFTEATMKQIGSTAKVATPDALRDAGSAIVKQMDDAVRGVDIVPNTAQATTAARVAADYVERVPAGQLTPRVRGIAKEIEALAKAGKTVPLERLKTWRSDIGNLTISPDGATREAAHNMRKLLDEMTDTALVASGREADIASLAAGREAYRNFIAVRDAASRAGAEGGNLSPQALNQSMIRAQGRENYATGRTTPMADFTRSAASALRPAPTVAPGGVRSFSEAIPGALGAAAGFGALGAGAGPLGAILAGVGGALAPAAGQAAMRSAPIQSMLRDPLRALTEASRIAPGLLAQ